MKISSVKLMQPNLTEDDGFLMTIKTLRMTSFGGEVTPAVPSRKILGNVKEPYKYENKYFVGKIHGYFSPRFSCLVTRCLCWLLPYSSGLRIRSK
jgi:hypothetical protein